MKHVYDKSFKYRKAVDTDIAATFRRIRSEQDKNAKEVAAKVKPLVRGKVAA